MTVSNSGRHFQWQWPDTGPTPVNYGLDTEIFDSEKFPHAQTLVREAIQNSLDARLDRSRPVTVRFAFHEGPVDGRDRFLEYLRRLKGACGMSWPDEWGQGKMKWLVVEDSNSSGLNGSIRSRTSDFWNYWLNFGISNKSGAGRGGRGIGRITFLIASGISTVIGITRRASDGSVVACGMSLLKPVMVDDEFKSSYAYLASAPSGSVYDLYEGEDFVDGLSKNFLTSDYSASVESGLSLVIPFPHASLEPGGIAAAAIEHFAPAIVQGSLVVEVDGHSIDHSSIDAHALALAPEFSPGPMREDPTRVLSLVRDSAEEPGVVLTAEKPGAGLRGCVDGETTERLRESFEKTGRLGFAIDVPLVRHGQSTLSRMRGVVARAPNGMKPADLFFREGMCLPEVEARNPADVDLVLNSDDGVLVSYLNFCEGKAHLGLIENREVRTKLQDSGFDGSFTVKRFVRHLMDDIRTIVLPDMSKPDASTFSGFFSLPREDTLSRKGTGNTGPGNPRTPPRPPSPPELPRRPSIFIVDELPDGFRVRANPEQTQWPAGLRIEVAYADGSRRPSWSVHDFDLERLSVVRSGAAGELVVTRNVMTIRDCEADFVLEVRGFDIRRELVTSVKGFRVNA